MHLRKIFAVYRAERFSPNSIEKDAAVLRCVCDELTQRGYSVEAVSEGELGRMTVAGISDDVSCCISMGREKSTLFLYGKWAYNTGKAVVNASAGVALCCNRRKVTETLSRAGIPLPAEHGSHGYWAKRADGVAEGACDVQFAANLSELDAVIHGMRGRGVDDIIVSAHVPGDLVKFYGVRSTGFFHICYPGDDGQWKFDDERRNGRPHHYAFSMDGLRSAAERASAAVGVDVYGGDCIVRADGSFCIIDFNDWPSFSRCREDAAVAIADIVEMRMAERVMYFKTNLETSKLMVNT